ncbi:MAG: arginine--tRNA ligase, partial [Bacteroidota bacterium]
MNLDQALAEHIKQAFKANFEADVKDISLQPTKKDFAGSHTFVTFPYSKISRKKPEETAQILGEYLKKESEFVKDFNVVKGFLNLEIEDRSWMQAFRSIQHEADFGDLAPQESRVMVEFSSPNTNKPLHLGHLRNNFLGDAISRILGANGYKVFKTNLVNDRGIHICKSMVAYLRHGQEESPESSGIKGDHLVGKYYVLFDKDLKKESAELSHKILNEGEDPSTLGFEGEDLVKVKALRAKLKEADLDEKKKKEVEDALKKLVQNQTSALKEAKEMLQRWESGDAETVALWKIMNGWVYQGFDKTYRKIGIAFDRIYYESNTYLLGKDVIDEGLEKKLFYQEEDGSVWIDLSQEKLDKKLLLRSDGTSVYMTQDLGTAELKFKDFKIDKSIYVVGNEQDYHFKVLFSILDKMGRSYAPGLYHLSYGMVDLPTGKMKSREGTVVDADDLVRQMIDIARERTNALGKTEGFSEEELQKLYEIIALGALKYFLLKVDPKKRMLFNPEESVDFEGDAAPFIQYNFARISSLLQRAKSMEINYLEDDFSAYPALKDS